LEKTRGFPALRDALTGVISSLLAELEARFTPQQLAAE
jgi:hypothetical protein